MPRSPELRGELSGSLDAGEIHDQAKKGIQQAKETVWQRKQGRPEELERQYAEEQEAIAKLEAAIAELRVQAESMEDEEFEHRFVEVSSGISATKERIFRYAHEEDARSRWTAFVDMKEIGGYKEFIEKWPMYWMPRKEEVARILSVAKQMHDARGAGKDEPLRILEIGGANAAFADLLVDIAEENGIAVEYGVIDPEAETVKEAAMAHVGDGRFSFHAETAGQFATKAHEGDAELTRLLTEREALKAEGEVKLRDLRALEDVIRKLAGEGKLDEAARRRYAGILEKDFDIIMSRRTVADDKAFLRAFRDGYDPDSHRVDVSVISEYFAGLQRDIDAMTHVVEGMLMEKPPAYDLVINAWMPPSMDFTKDIRAANGAAVLYAIEPSGATGIQDEVGSVGRSLGEEESYGTGRMYRMESAWVGYSLPALRKKERMRGTEFEYDDDDEAFSNAFLIQRRVDIGRGQGMLDPDPERAGIKVGEPYPWEAELTKNQGEVSPVVPIGGVRGSKKDYHDDLDALMEELRDARKHRDKERF